MECRGVVLGAALAVGLGGCGRAVDGVSTEAARERVWQVADAQRTYARASGGTYATLACLADPHQCGVGGSGEALVPAEYVSETAQQGYTFTLHLGPPVPAAPGVTAGARTFAYVAAAAAGTRAFSYCLDDTNVLVSVPPGAPPPRVTDGRCVPPESTAAP